ncbi:MAG: LON peptidase substrate-binding domain-containing protein [Myxococcota bacterium]|nr:LON peptidase substrate-binding domain-containing protein [Myxococcota bacterium]
MTERLPLLPLREACLLPGARMEIRVGRPGSVQALGQSGDGLVVVQQRQATNARPRQAEEFFVYGCTAEVDDVQPDASALAVTLVGLQRVKLVGVSPQMLSLQGLCTAAPASCEPDTHEAILALYGAQRERLKLPELSDPHLAVYGMARALEIADLQAVLDADDLSLPLQACLERIDRLAGVEWLH